MRFSTASASFIFSARVRFAALSTKISIFEGKDVIYYSLLTCSVGLEALRILFKSLLDHELNSFIGSLEFVLRFERSFINVATDLSSLYLVKNCS